MHWLRQKFGFSLDRRIGGVVLRKLLRAGNDCGKSDPPNAKRSQEGQGDRNARVSSASTGFGKGRFAFARRRPRALILVSLGAVAGAAYFALDSDPPDLSRLSRIPPIDATPGGTR